MNKYNILNTPCFQVENKESSKVFIKGIIKQGKGGYSTAINAEKILMYSKNPLMKEIIDNSLLPIPDGSGAVLALKYLHGLNSIRLDLPNAVFELANEEKYRLFLLGSSEENNILAVEKLKEKFPGINIVGRENGYFDNETQVIEKLNESNPQIVMVALGSPKQEKFSARVNKLLPHTLFIGCGGAIDILAGKVKRAPVFYQDNHLEWLYRLISQPKRIKRQKMLPVFFGKLLIESIKIRFSRN